MISLESSFNKGGNESSDLRSGVSSYERKPDRELLRRKSISALRAAYEAGFTDFAKDINEPEVKEFHEIYGEFATTANDLEGEERVLAFVDEYMLPFDAGLITEKEKLEEFDKALVDGYYKMAVEDGLNILKKKVEECRERISEKMSEVK